MSTILSKISPKNMGIDPAIGKEGAKALFSIIGRANGAKSGNTQYGDYHKLQGQFEAVNYETGDIFVSGNCFLPQNVTDLIVGKLGSGENPVEVQFAYEIGVKPSKSQIGYEFTVKALVKADEADSLSDLRSAAKLALEAPSK